MTSKVTQEELDILLQLDSQNNELNHHYDLAFGCHKINTFYKSLHELQQDVEKVIPGQIEVIGKNNQFQGISTVHKTPTMSMLAHSHDALEIRREATPGNFSLMFPIQGSVKYKVDKRNLNADAYRTAVFLTGMPRTAIMSKISEVMIPLDISRLKITFEALFGIDSNKIIDLSVDQEINLQGRGLVISKVLNTYFSLIDLSEDGINCLGIYDIDDVFYRSLAFSMTSSAVLPQAERIELPLLSMICEYLEQLPPGPIYIVAVCNKFNRSLHSINESFLKYYGQNIYSWIGSLRSRYSFSAKADSSTRCNTF